MTGLLTATTAPPEKPQGPHDDLPGQINANHLDSARSTRPSGWQGWSQHGDTPGPGTLSWGLAGKPARPPTTQRCDQVRQRLEACAEQSHAVAVKSLSNQEFGRDSR
jgi:hypothetical protein